jgi:hypothetical protein
MKIQTLFFSSISVLFLFSYCRISAQSSKLAIEVRCYDSSYILNSANSMKFVISIRNEGSRSISIYQRPQFGHYNFKDSSDITFELLHLKGKDTIDALKNVSLYSMPRLRRYKDKIKLFPLEAYLFEFEGLSSIYFREPGEYRIRFTLHGTYAEEYMDADISTKWITIRAISGK